MIYIYLGRPPWPTEVKPELREPELKAALIDGLFNEGMVDEQSVIVSEMPVSGMSRRADLVLANGRLLAFEIKSDGDKMNRLEGQLATYQRSFEGVVVICGSRHAANVLRSTDSTVGVFVVEERGHGGSTMLRKPHIRHLDASAALQHMHGRDLYRLLRRVGMTIPDLTDRSSLEKVARNLPAATLRAAAISAIKERYRTPYTDFISTRDGSCTLNALPSLRRKPWNRPIQAADLRHPADPEAAQPLPMVNIIPRRVQPKTSS